MSKWIPATAAALIVLGGVGLASAAPPVGPPPGVKPPVDNIGKPPGVKPPGGKPPGKIAAPEIDATSGVQAMAFLTGVLLLMGEGIRRRRNG